MALVTLASDGFSRPNANPMGGFWTPESTNLADFWCANQIISGQVYASVSDVTGSSFYNGVSWPNDQWSQVTIGSIILGSAGEVGVNLRSGAAGAETDYQLVVGDNYPDGFTWGIISTHGADYDILANDSVSGQFLASGDVIYGSVQGTYLKLVRNGVILGTVQDSAHSSGSAGLALSTSTYTDASISAWSGGGFNSNTYSYTTAYLQNLLVANPNASSFPISCLLANGTFVVQPTRDQLQAELDTRLAIQNEIYGLGFLPVNPT